MARRSIKRNLLILSFVCLTLGVSGINCCISPSKSFDGVWLRVLSGALGTACLLLTVMTARMSTLRISDGHTVTTALLHYILLNFTLLRNALRMRDYQSAWGNPRHAQEELLRSIIRRNGSTVYGRQHELKEIQSLDDLRRRHPLTTYEHYRSYIDRMAVGENCVMTAEAPMRFALTSGTTGKAKMWPYLKSFISDSYKVMYGLVSAISFATFKERSVLQQDIWLYTAPKTRYTEGGILMGPGSLIAPWMKKFLVILSTPGEGFFISRPFEATYIHLLFGLRDRNLGGIMANFTSNLMSAMHQLEHCWEDVVRDIEQGTISYLNLDADVQKKLTRALGGGDPERAAELKREFQKGFDGIIGRVWPHLQYINAVDSAGLRGVLLDTYAKGITIYASGFGATEGMMGINLWITAGKDAFVLLPSYTVFEFIPEENMEDENPETLFIDQLEVGGIYEIVITQIFGCYRFRYGDVIRVTRFHMNTPVAEFMYRSGQMLNVMAEKVDQRTVNEAMQTAVDQWPGVQLRDYAVAESSLLSEMDQRDKSVCPYYIIFIELDQDPEMGDIDQDQYCLIDSELQRLSFTYKSYREKGCIAVPSVHIVKPGTFSLLHDFILTNTSTTANQYKVPRKLRTPQMLRLMLDNSTMRSNTFGRMAEL